MDESTLEEDVQLPPFTVSPACQIHFLSLPDNPEWNARFQEVLRQFVLTCSRYIDLSMLDGVTVGFDYDTALDSVDLGYESSRAKQYTNADGLVGVGKMLRVLRNGELRVHVVVNANCLTRMVDHNFDQNEFWLDANLLAHELAHVEVTSWFYQHSPNVLLNEWQGDWAIACMRDAAHTIWEEYAACVLSAGFSNGNAVTESMVCALETSVNGAMSRARKAIKSYRMHADVGRLLTEVGAEVATPLKMAAYLLGHLDGLGEELNLNTHSITTAESEFGPFIPILLSTLRDAWVNRTSWNGVEGLDGIVNVIVETMRAAGATVTLSQNPPGSRIDVPFTAETMPNGEADMAMILIAEVFGRLV